MNKLSIQKNPKGVSVVICCYNSEKVIAKTLQYLSKQKTEKDISWEVVLINNNSIDNTVQVAKNAWDDSACAPFRIVEEATSGIIAARKKGVRVSQYEYIIFCDDDNWLNPNYIQEAYEIMESDFSIGVLGGRGIPVFEEKQPSWMKYFLSSYACGPQGEKNGDITKNKKYAYGAGSVYRKSVLVQFLAIMDIAPGRDSEKLSGGEDKLLGLLHVICEYKIKYNAQLTFSHFIPGKKINLKYLLLLTWHNGENNVYLKPFIDYINGHEIIGNKRQYALTKFKNILATVKNNFSTFLIREVFFKSMFNITRNIGSIFYIFKFKGSYQEHIKQVKIIIDEIQKG